mgnify:CR=1 FL=1
MYARAGINWLLAVVRKVVDKAADQRVRHQPTCGDAAFKNIWLGRLLTQCLAALAYPLAIDVAMYKELGRNNV